MFKDVLQEMLEQELSSQLGYEKGDSLNKNTSNRRNGYSKKTVKSQYRDIELDIPRGRQSDFEPVIFKDLYGIEISAQQVSRITNFVIESAKEWQNRPLEPIYPFVFMDVIHFKVRYDGKIKNKAAYVVLGVNIDGFKDILGIWIGENETSKFWYTILTDLKNRGVKDILIFSVDRLPGFKESITACYPQSTIQRCIIYQIRNTFKYVSYKDSKELMKDFKIVYKAVNKVEALLALDFVEEKWGSKYPSAIKSYRNNY